MTNRVKVGLGGVLVLLLMVLAVAIDPNSPTRAQLAASSGFTYQEITSSASTQVKAGPGQLHSVIVSSPGTSWTIQIFDNASACSGTAIFGATAVTVPAAGTVINFDVQALNGICVKTAGTAGEITVTTR